MKREVIETLEKFNVIKLYTDGNTLSEIKSIVGYSGTTISKYLKENGVELRKASKRESLREAPIIGSRYGQYTVISDRVKSGSEIADSESRNIYWEVQCECGKVCWKSSAALKSGRVNACKSCSRKLNNINSVINSYFNRIIYSLKTRSVGKLEFNITPEYLQKLYDDNPRCAYTGIDLSFDKTKSSAKDQVLSLDRIDSAKGYIEGNVQWVHKDINMMKGSLSHDQFIKYCKLVSGLNVVNN